MNEHNGLEVGHIVTLNSGSPKMTVQALLGSGDVQCVWFQSHSVSMVGDGKTETVYLMPLVERFHSKTLTRAE